MAQDQFTQQDPTTQGPQPEQPAQQLEKPPGLRTDACYPAEGESADDAATDDR
jgi:hypothetical protein